MCRALFALPLKTPAGSARVFFRVGFGKGAWAGVPPGDGVCEQYVLILKGAAA